MKSIRLTHPNGTERLALVFLGWGTDSNALCGTSMEGLEVVALWDYRSLETEGLGLTERKGVDVIAWSMGVWAAERYISLHPEVNWGRTVALCGSPRPVDDSYGISVATVRGTLEGWNERSRRKFNIRMYGGATAMETQSATLSSRPTEEQAEELRAIIGMQEATHSPMLWDKAYIGEDDMIFSPENLRRYWDEGHARETIGCPMPHYPFGFLRNLRDLTP